MDRIERDLAREELKIASDAKRIKAYLIDETLIALVFIASTWERFLAAANDPIAQIEIVVSHFFWVVLLYIAYHAIFVALYGATLGKIWQRIVLIEIDSLAKPSFLIALARSLLRVVGGFFMGFGFVWAFATPLRQTWHDKISRVIAVDA
jgi:uncharacterized RDD family membrane protein YckC